MPRLSAISDDRYPGPKVKRITIYSSENQVNFNIVIFVKLKIRTHLCDLEFVFGSYFTQAKSMNPRYKPRQLKVRNGSVQKDHFV